MKCRAKSFLLSSRDRVFGNCNHKFCHSCLKRKTAVEKLEAALLLNPSNFNALHSLFLSTNYGHSFVLLHRLLPQSDWYRLIVYD